MATDHSSLAGAEVVSLRPYQQTLVDGVRAALRTGKRRVMAYLPTGGGKTRRGDRNHADEPEQVQGRIIVLANRKQLVHQFAAALRSAGLDVGIAQGENTTGLHHHVIVASIETEFMQGNTSSMTWRCSSSMRRTPSQEARSTAPCCSATTACPASG